jgi:hypothetical protein
VDRRFGINVLESQALVVPRGSAGFSAATWVKMHPNIFIIPLVSIENSFLIAKGSI